MKKIIYGLFAISLISQLAGCSWVKTDTKQQSDIVIKLSSEDKNAEKQQNESDLSKWDLLTMFEEVNDEEVYDFLYDDYNKDGIHEAFVITKGKKYKLWYMTANGCEELLEDVGLVDNIKSTILEFYTKDYFLLQREIEGIKNTKVYSINNQNMVFEPEISGDGYLYTNEDGQLILEITDNDGSVKEYYLYYVMDEGFKEFGAIPISQEQFLEFEGAEQIIEQIEEEYKDTTLDFSFLYRSNGYINMNIMFVKEGEAEYKNMLLKYDESKVEVLSKELQEGKVEIAHMLDMATFPTTFRYPVRSNQ